MPAQLAELPCASSRSHFATRSERVHSVAPEIRVGAYVVGRHLRGVERYPLVLMLEPLFRCNLACAGCGKIDYPDPILNQRLSVNELAAGGL